MECVFCSLIRDGTARWVIRGPVVSAFAPLNPLAPGHTLVIPTTHYADIFETPPDVLAGTMTTVQLLASKMRSGLKAGGVNILSANGPGSEQSIPHVHFHVVPRWADDGLSTWPSRQSRHEVAGDPVARLVDALSDSHPS
ncbi:HIT domain-containing protein [Streptomyces sp. A0642]|uniref:HIT family protein n=1 Tax=Streptomyces sp. A0642 TaxID=2563100 RepID=UPI0010A222F8|nr:HIT domain-containing protein [Streptomyces sp. A0642]THA77671.1 HIT domain-containing protein [Streptomyces sp. A0642]